MYAFLEMILLPSSKEANKQYFRFNIAMALVFPLVFIFLILFTSGCAKISNVRLFEYTITHSYRMYNTLPFDVYVKATEVSNYDWNSAYNRPDVLFDYRKIASGESFSFELKMNGRAHGHPATFYFCLSDNDSTFEAIDRWRMVDADNLGKDIPDLEEMTSGSPYQGKVQVITVNDWESLRARWSEIVLANGSCSMTDWMARLPDQVYLSEITAPGTHDSGTWRFTGYAAIYYVCQNLSILQTLEKGARFVDLRIGVEDGELWFWHGSKNMYTRFVTGMDEIKQFLTEHPTETILMRAMVESGGATTKDLFYRTITGEAYAAFFVSPPPGEIPQLGDVRGKCLLLCDGNITTDPSLGVYFNYTSNTQYELVPWLNAQNSSWAVGDYWDCSDPSYKEGSVDHYLGTLMALTVEERSVLPVLFISASNFAYGPDGMAYRLNPVVFQKIAVLDPTKRKGFIVMDFLGTYAGYTDLREANGLAYLLVSLNMTKWHGQLQ